MKMEETFLVLRDGDGADPLQDASIAMGSAQKMMFNEDEFVEGSIYRNLPDEAAGFEDVLMRGEADL